MSEERKRFYVFDSKGFSIVVDRIGPMGVMTGNEVDEEGLEWIAKALNDAHEGDKDKRIAELESRIHEAKEVYTGMEGVTPETDLEKYLMRVLDQMYEELRETCTVCGGTGINPLGVVWEGINVTCIGCTDETDSGVSDESTNN